MRWVVWLNEARWSRIVALGVALVTSLSSISPGLASVTECASSGAPSERQPYSAQNCSGETGRAEDTLWFRFDTSLEGWHFWNTPDTLQVYYRDSFCIEADSMAQLDIPFELSWQDFLGAGTGCVYCPF